MTTTLRLNDLELVLLSGAAARGTGSLMPLPASVSPDAARTGKAIAGLLRRRLIEELPVTDRSLCWREADQDLIGLFITAAGPAAMGVDEESDAACVPDEAGAAAGSGAPPAEPAQGGAEPANAPLAAPPPAAPPRAGSKIAAVAALLERAEGATLDELVAATGWQPHTMRAALTGLRKQGLSIAKAKRGDVTCYHIAKAG